MLEYGWFLNDVVLDLILTTTGGRTACYIVFSRLISRCYLNDQANSIHSDEIIACHVPWPVFSKIR